MTIKDILKRALAGILLYFLFKNMTVILSKPVNLEYYIVAIAVVLFDWDTRALCGSAIISTLIRLYLKI